MRKGFLLLIALAVVVILAAGGVYIWKMKPSALPGAAPQNSTEKGQGVMVGGALMTPERDIITNATGSAELTTLVSAVDMAGLTNSLKGSKPITLFAPTNQSFAELPAGTMDTLSEPEHVSDLVGILTYHMVSGKYTTKELKDGLVLTTVQGGTLTVGYKGNKWTVTDATGKTASITVGDVLNSNGVTFVIDRVLMPK